MKKKKGVALAFTLFALVIFSTLGLGMLVVMLTSSKGSFSYQNTTKALDYATAGVERSIANLETPPPYSPWQGDTENIGNGAFAVNIQALSPVNGFLLWSVTSTGSSGGASRTITAVLSQQSFAQYGYFSNNENLPNEPNQEWWIGGNVVEGPVGTNGFFLYYTNPAYTDKVTSANGCFPGESCGSDPAYQDPYYNYNQNKYTGQSPPDPTNPKYFYHYYSSYNNDYPVAYNNSQGFSFQGGQPYIPWPTVNVSTMQQNANKVYTGDTLMTMNSNGTVTVKTGGTIVDNSGQPLSYSGGTTSTFTIPPSGGTLFVEDGNVMLSGSLKGQLTIVTGPSSSPPNKCTSLPSVNGAPPQCGNVDIVGNTVYNDKTLYSNSYSGQDRLGIVATGDVNLDPYSVPSNVEVDASAMALPQTISGHVIHTGVGVRGYAYTCQDNGSGCTSNFCYTGSCPPAEQNFYMYGGMLPELGGDPVGIFDPGSGRILSGYNQIFYYDTNMARNPPPNFPITGKIQIVEWADSNALGH